MIKAIETHYAGCRFRSRLEARWAVFFDHMGLSWEYEPQGFELPSGRYLPDFYLPGAHIWVEIKGARPTELELQKLDELTEAQGDRGIVFFGDIPRSIWGQDQGTGAFAHQYEYGRCDCDPQPLSHQGLLRHIRSHSETCAVHNKISKWTETHPLDAYGLATGDRSYESSRHIHEWPEGMTAARSARFEFGESG